MAEWVDFNGFFTLGTQLDNCVVSSCEGMYDLVKRDETELPIPGRDAPFIVDNGRNITKTIFVSGAYIGTGNKYQYMQTMSRALRSDSQLAFLAGYDPYPGYWPLSASYLAYDQQNRFCFARCVDAVFTPFKGNKFGMDVTFDAVPILYYKNNSHSKTVGTSYSAMDWDIHDPINHRINSSYPLISFSGGYNGTLTLGFYSSSTLIGTYTLTTNTTNRFVADFGKRICTNGVEGTFTGDVNPAADSVKIKSSVASTSISFVIMQED